MSEIEVLIESLIRLAYKWAKERPSAGVELLQARDNLRVAIEVKDARIAALEAKLAAANQRINDLGGKTAERLNAECDLLGLKVTALEAELAALREANKATCPWREDSDGNWETSCGALWEFMNDGPEENNVNYCFYCGKWIAIKKYVEESEEELANN